MSRSRRNARAPLNRGEQLESDIVVSCQAGQVERRDARTATAAGRIGSRAQQLRHDPSATGIRGEMEKGVSVTRRVVGAGTAGEENGQHAAIAEDTRLDQPGVQRGVRLSD